MIKDELVTYDVAKLAKEKGFNERTRYYYETNCVNPKAIEHCSGSDYFNKYPKAVSAPTQSLLQRWLREEKGIHIEIVATGCGYVWIADETDGTSITDSDILDRGPNEGGCFDAYELALEDALKYALENLV